MTKDELYKRKLKDKIADLQSRLQKKEGENTKYKSALDKHEEDAIELIQWVADEIDPKNICSLESAHSMYDEFYK